MLVVDASVVVPALTDEGIAGDRARTRFGGAVLAAPELIDVEVLSALRKFVRSGEVGEARARAALDDLAALPLERATHRDLLTRSWQLRQNVTAYDALYVALAEALGAPLVTADARLARATGPRCVIEVLSS